MTNEQANRVTREYSAIAGEPVRVEKIGSTLYAFCSELGALRLYRKFHGKGRAEYSANLNTWFFALENEFLAAA